jgi:hypothetical protein
MMKRGRLIFTLVSLAIANSALAQGPITNHQQFDVEMGAGLKQVGQGRLLIFASKATTAESEALAQSNGKSNKVTQVDANAFAASQTTVAAREVGLIRPGQTISVDGDSTVFPVPFSQLSPGEYYVQAVLDVDHSYAYTGRHAGDIVSDVVKMHLPSTGAPMLKLAATLPASDPWTLSGSASADTVAKSKAAHEHAHLIDANSAVMAAFWGRPITLRGWVLTPPSYEKSSGERYPTVYVTSGFGTNLDSLVRRMVEIYDMMAKGATPPMIWVFLDHATATGTHEFADSVNNGPWGEALTHELIPRLEKSYRMDGRASGRFLTGHSSGGWSTLWLQTRYPKLFGGAWATSPDPSDFHDFNGVDLYAAGANMYRKPDGSPYPLVRDKGEVKGTVEQFAGLERVLGEYGGQLASLEWVFSPRGVDGRPQPMFDRDTGAVDPKVVQYWHDQYDIAHLVEKNWRLLQPDLSGKIHVVVGTADNFYLDGAVHKLQAVLDGLHAKSTFTYLQDKTHFDLYAKGDDRLALYKQIIWEMYAVARPKSVLKAPATK